jgi:hypothetical protein
MVTLAQLDAIIAKFVTRGFNDIVPSADHNDVCDAIKAIRDLIAGLGAGGLEGFAHGKIEVADEKSISRTSSGVKCISLGSLKLGVSSMEWLNFWLNLQGELRISAEGGRSIVFGAIHTGNHPENEEIDTFPASLGDYVWDVVISEYGPVYILRDESYLNNSRVGTGSDVYLVLWFGIQTWYETALTAYCRNVKYHLPVFCHVV